MKKGQETASNPSVLLGAYSQFINDTKNWDDVRRVLAQRDLSDEEFFSTIPQPVAEFALLLRAPLIYPFLVATAPTEVGPALKSAKEAADKYFRGIEEHPVVLKVMGDRLKRAPVRRAESLTSGTTLTEFTEFNATPIWMDGDDVIAPAVAISLVSSSGKLVMKATVDWDDLSFLAWVTTNLLKSEFQRAVKMAKKQKIDIPFGEVIGYRITEMTAALREISQLAPSLRIVGSESSKAEKKPET
jgi:hypothetical protein